MALRENGVCYTSNKYFNRLLTEVREKQSYSCFSLRLKELLVHNYICNSNEFYTLCRQRQNIVSFLYFYYFYFYVTSALYIQPLCMLMFYCLICNSHICILTQPIWMLCLLVVNKVVYFPTKNRLS